MTTPIFNTEKSLNAVLYVAERLQIKDFHKIFKILYFADRQHLAKYGRPITGDTYIKMMNGPVPSNIYDIFKIVRGDSVVLKGNNTYSKLFVMDGYYCIKPIQAANLDYLSESDIEELDSSLSKYGNLPFEKIKELSHDLAWSSARDDSPISVKDILREAGEQDDYISYICGVMNVQRAFCNYGN
jgi:uncharacterized phage-associated protein